MKANAMIPSKFLKKDDADPARVVTIRGIKQVNVAQDDKPEELKYCLFFTELDKPLVLNSTNIQLLTHYLGTDETDEWKGKKVEIYNDPSVSYGGKLTGGVRVRLPSGAAQGKPAQAKTGGGGSTGDDFDDGIPF
jgi:hypothetical protein